MAILKSNFPQYKLRKVTNKDRLGRSAQVSIVEILTAMIKNPEISNRHKINCQIS